MSVHVILLVNELIVMLLFNTLATETYDNYFESVIL